MKKKLFFTTIILIFFIGCTIDSFRIKDKPPKKETKLILKFDSSSIPNRTITPDIDMNPSTYDVTGDGPDGAKFMLFGIKNDTVTIKNLVGGTWVINIITKNEDGIAIGDGSTVVEILKDSTVTNTVIITPLEGNGALLLTIDWSIATQFTENAAVTGTVEYKNETGYDPTQDISFNKTGETAICNLILNAGYYRLKLQIEEGLNKVILNPVAVRIVYNATTSGTINIIPGEGGLTLDIVVDMQNPIIITFTGQQSTIDLSADMTVSSITIPTPVDFYEWYLNGELVGTDSSITIGSELNEGSYILSLIACKGRIMGSKSINFKVEAVVIGQIIDDFEDGIDPNLWGGVYASFASDIGGESITKTYDSLNGRNGSTYCYKIEYDAPNDTSYVGLKINLADGGNERDISIYKYLTFWTKGSVNNIPIKIEITNGSSSDRSKALVYVNDYLEGGITTNWQEVKIPLDAFCNLDSLTNVNGIVFVLEHDYSMVSGFPTNGILYIDDIGFGDTSLGYVKIDSFGDNWGLNSLGANTGSMNSHAIEYDDIEYHTSSRSLKSIYDPVASGGWDGLFMLFGGSSDGWNAVEYDFSAYNTLTLWVKAKSDTENPEVFKIEITDNIGNNNIVVPDETVEGSPITTSWQKYTIDLNSINSLNKSTIKQFNIIYEEARIISKGGDLTGVVYYDDIQFEE